MINPMTAVAAISRGLLTLQGSKTARPSAPISAVSQSPSDLAGRHARADDRADRRGIGPLDEALTFGLARWRKRIGATATIRNSDGKKISIVDTSDPQKPATRNSLPFSHPVCCTRSFSRKGTMTRPLPKVRLSVFRKNTGKWLSADRVGAFAMPMRTGAPARSEIGVLPPRNHELYRGCREYWPL